MKLTCSLAGPAGIVKYFNTRPAVLTLVSANVTKIRLPLKLNKYHSNTIISYTLSIKMTSSMKEKSINVNFKALFTAADTPSK